MKRLLLALLLISPVSFAHSVIAPLDCDVSRLCVGYLKNCTVSPCSFLVDINPDENNVVIEGKKIFANFSDEGKVRFSHLGYTVELDKYEFSAILYNEKQVRSGWYKKLTVAR